MHPTEQIKSIRLFCRYKHYDVLGYRFKDVDDCVADNITLFGQLIGKWPYSRDGLGYGVPHKPGHMIWIVMEWIDGNDIKHIREFPDVKTLVMFLKQSPAIAKAIGYVPK
jgi:hypothetical protein